VFLKYQHQIVSLQVVFNQLV